MTNDEVIAARRDAWRTDHPEYGQFWRLALFQAVQALRNPGTEFSAKAIAFRYDRKTGFLEMILPSGRTLTYPRAELFEDEFGSVSFTFLDASGSASGWMYHERKNSGVFGGLLLENITQALCRDIFVEAMPRLEAAGYPIVMHTHDEYVCEIPGDFGSLDEFLKLITTPPAWAPDLPIAAKARIADRLIEVVESPAKAESTATDNVIDNAVISENGADDAEVENEEVEEKEEACGAPQGGHWRDVEPGEIFGPGRHFRMDQTTDRSQVFDPGIARDDLAPPSLPSDGPPIPPSRPPGCGNGAGDSSASWRGESRSNGYPHGEHAGPSAGPAVDEYIYKDARGRLHMRVVRTAAKSFPTYSWAAGAWARRTC